jgi:D-alanyl-lipoteichoic acid acyltransferase DltB (MBOAT superfamily)
MVFNSTNFFIFFIIFTPIYFSLNSNLKLQNLFILISSLIFYSFWDYRFVFLLIGSTTLDYYFGKLINHEKRKLYKRFYFQLSIITNISLLFYFKYINFILNTINDIFTNTQVHHHFNKLNIILPIGISFYTFHSLSYIIDIYYKKIKPTDDYIAYASFVCFFPQLVAGPISRAGDMLPKFLQKRSIDYDKIMEGISQIILGFFKKIVVADSIAIYVDNSYANLYLISDFQILISVYFYSFQIYCDFSGYTDIALGLGKIFGIEFKINFDRPYLSRNFTDFWKKWHISLSTWLRDYLYIPLGGNKNGNFNMYRNLFLTMLLGGLWHGASFNFIIWGALHGLFLIIQKLIKLKLNSYFSILLTFMLTTITWIFFRSQSFTDSIYIINRIFTLNSFNLLELFTVAKCLYLTILLIIFDIFYYNYFNFSGYKRFCINLFFLLNIVTFATYSGNSFIYFQF